MSRGAQSWGPIAGFHSTWTKLKAFGYGWVTFTGGIFTAFFVGYVATMLHFRWSDFLELDLNEVGDLFAGIGGPIALLWVVLAYLQQGHELREATKQNKELTDATNGQLKVAREAQELANERHVASFEPVFAFQMSMDYEKVTQDLEIKSIMTNIGHSAASVEVCSTRILLVFPTFNIGTDGEIITDNQIPLLAKE